MIRNILILIMTKSKVNKNKPIIRNNIFKTIKKERENLNITTKKAINILKT